MTAEAPKHIILLLHEYIIANYEAEGSMGRLNAPRQFRQTLRIL